MINVPVIIFIYVRSSRMENQRDEFVLLEVSLRREIVDVRKPGVSTKTEEEDYKTTIVSNYGHLSPR